MGGCGCTIVGGCHRNLSEYLGARRAQGSYDAQPRRDEEVGFDIVDESERSLRPQPHSARRVTAPLRGL